MRVSRQILLRHWAAPTSVLLHGIALTYLLVHLTPTITIPSSSDAPPVVIEVMTLPQPTPPEAEPEVVQEVVEEAPRLIESVMAEEPAPPPEVKPKPPEPKPGPKPKPVKTPPKTRPLETAPVETVQAAPQPPAPPVVQQQAVAAPPPPAFATPTPDYVGLIRAQLERNKVYPRTAQQRRQQGRAMLRIVIDRRGNVLNYKLEQSSGHQVLDHEVVAMVQRASPLPSIPANIAGERLELVVPVEFFLR